MTKLSRYIKAFPIEKFREFPDWPSDLGSAQGRGNNGNEATEGGNELLDLGCLFLHDNYVVTRSIFPDEGIIFDQITPEWRQFCQETLKFAIPPEAEDDPSEAAFLAESNSASR